MGDTEIMQQTVYFAVFVICKAGVNPVVGAFQSVFKRRESDNGHAGRVALSVVYW